MKVLILNGVARSGKDTFANEIISEANKIKNIYVCSLSTVSLVKEVCQLVGINPKEKNDKNRAFMSNLKDLLTNHSNIPFKNVVKKIEDCCCDISIIMCREPVEIQKFKDYYDDCTTILIERDGIHIPNNDADQNVQRFSYDKYIFNESIDSLKKTAREMFNEIMVAINKNS